MLIYNILRPPYFHAVTSPRNFLVDLPGRQLHEDKVVASDCFRRSTRHTFTLASFEDLSETANYYMLARSSYERACFFTIHYDLLALMR